MELKKQYEWSKKGKRYRTKYLDTLGQLFGELENDKERQSESTTVRGSRADSFGDVVNKTGN